MIAPTKNKDAAELLDACDRFMSGAEITAEERAVCDAVASAASFAAKAYDVAPLGGADCHALGRSFLLALIDPLHEDLDYLRADPKSGAVGRAKRDAPTDYTTRAEAYVATCPSPAVAYAVIAGLMLGYTPYDVAKTADVTREAAMDVYWSIRAAMCEGFVFTDAAQEALRAALKRRVEA